jgi:hypothetical protein
MSVHGGSSRLKKILRRDGREQNYRVGSSKAQVDPAVQSRDATSSLRGSTKSLAVTSLDQLDPDTAWREKWKEDFDKYRNKLVRQATKQAVGDIERRFADTGAQFGYVVLNPDSYDAGGHGNGSYANIKDDPMVGWMGVRSGNFAEQYEKVRGVVTANVGGRDVIFDVVHSRRQKVKLPFNEKQSSTTLTFRGCEVTPANIEDMVARDADGTFDQRYKPKRA